MTTDRLRTRLLATTIICGMALAAPALAQTTAPGGTGGNGGPDATQTPNTATGRPADAGDGNDLIVVTGSRIAQPQLTSATPLTVVGQAELKLTGTSRVEDLINNLPQVFANQGANLSNGATGIATVDLRGLGPSRTLVLVNGKRLVPGDPRTPFADLNFIPAFLVQRIDVLTGGASSTYGSDAVSGVVNFVMDSNFEGFRIDGQYSFYQHDNAGDQRARDAQAASGIATPSGNTIGGQGYTVNMAIGLKSPDGRGHATVYAGYRTNEAVRQDERDFSKCALSESGDPIGSGGDLINGFDCGGSGTTAPARFRTNGGGPLTFRNFSVPVPGLSFPVATNGQGLPIDPLTGQVFINPGTAGKDAFGNPIPARPYRLGDAVPAFDTRATIPGPNGTTVPNPNFNRLLLNSAGGVVNFRNGASRVYNRGANNGSLRAYNGATDVFNYAPYNYYQRPDERFTLGGFAEYEVADFFKPYLEVMFMDDQTNAVIAPSGIFGQTLQVNCNNPLLSAQQVGEFCTNFGYGPNDSAPVAIGRRNIEGGGRDNNLNHSAFRIVVGSKGDLGAGFSYDVYGQYGRTRLQQIYFNDFSLVNSARAVQVVTDTRPGSATLGQPICRSVLDGTDPNCKPYNIFNGSTSVQPAVGAGVTQDALNYLQVPGFQTGTAVEQVVSGSITGNLGTIGIKSPFAESGIGIAVGGEYRSEDLRTDVDNEFATGDLAGQGGPTLAVRGGFNVAEAFGEISVPLVEKKPFFELLSFDAGYRYSSYNTAGTTDTYKVTGVYKPIKDVTFRGGYNRAVRAPNAVELFSPQSLSLFNGTDPCSGSIAQITARGLTAAQCANTGVTGSQFGTIDPSPAGQYTQFAGGNPNLKPEKSDSYTAGVVLTPRFLPRFSLTVDYFNIKISNLIGTVGAQLILNQCAQNGDPALCALVTRDPATGSLYQNANGFVTNTNVNIGSEKTSGIDIAANYRLDFSDMGLRLPGRLGFDFSGTWLNDITFEPGVLGSDLKTRSYNCKGYYGLTCNNSSTLAFEWRHQLRMTYTSPGGFQASVRWRYYSAVRNETLSKNVFLAGDAYLSDYRLSPQHYIDLAINVKATDRHSFRFGVNNVLDKDPPLVGSNALSGTFGNGNTYPNVYEALGRYFFAGFTGNF